jgi:acetyl-CoA synthetase
MKGQTICAFVSLKAGIQNSPPLVDELKGYVAKKVGPIARRDEILFAAELPKTRSGKIMRRVLASISNRDVGDVMTLANPDVVEQIRQMVQGKEIITTQAALPEDIAKFGQMNE